MGFCDNSFLLSTDLAADLFHRVAAKEPIVDYHCHLSPRDIAEDRQFEDLHAAWLDGDHYKWRAMRANGIPEDLITGSATTREKFGAWAHTVPATLRNPLFAWTHLELRRHFGIQELLEDATATNIWDEANRQLSQGNLTARGILTRMNVELVGTTDDPAESLGWHEALAKSGFGTRVVPTFRPDAAVRVGQPHAVQAWAKKLSVAAGVGADTFAGLVAALGIRHNDFAAAGCRATDHGIECLSDAPCTDSQAKTIWERAIDGTAASPEEAACFTLWLTLHVARLNHEKGWTTQLHLGAFRDPNPRWPAAWARMPAATRSAMPDRALGCCVSSPCWRTRVRWAGRFFTTSTRPTTPSLPGCPAHSKTAQSLEKSSGGRRGGLWTKSVACETRSTRSRTLASFPGL